MALFWLVHEIDGERRVMIREDTNVFFADVKAAIDGFRGTFVEAHALDAKTAKKIPKRMIGRTLTLDKAAALLDKMA